MINQFGFVSEDNFSEKFDTLNSLMVALIEAQGGTLKPTSWANVQALVRAGLHKKVFAIGDQLVCQKGSSNITWDVIGIDHDIPADRRFTHSLTLQLHDCLPSIMQFDAPEALYYAESGLPAGIYNFTIQSGYDETYGGGKTYQFTIDQAVPAKCGEWFKKGTKKPQPADLFFTRKTDFPDEDEYFSSHVGIVESVDGDKITTLEGNVDGYSYDWAGTSTFKRKTRYLSDWNMYAFYRPFWKDEQKTTTTSAKKDVEIYQLNSSKEVDYFVKVTASDGLNIRQGAGIKYSKLGAVPFNEVVKVTRFTSGGAYKWGLVEYDGIKGWIALDYTRKVSVEQLAHEVIQGKWGNGDTRKEMLGILYDDVQNRVNQMCK